MTTTARAEVLHGTRGLVQQSGALLQRFLEYADPSLLGDTQDVPITDWDILYSTLTPPSTASGSASIEPVQPSIVVRTHPAPDKHLFSVQSVLLGIDARQFWSLMANTDNRGLWDSTVELSAVQWWLADRLRGGQGSEAHHSEYEQVARRLSARVELLRFGSIMFVANKRDMVLLSIDTQLPSADGRLRLLSTSTSIDEPSLPPKKGYNRFQLHIGGFLVEDLGRTSTDKAIRVTQLSDLGEMAAWVPASIVKMVASTMVPRSMNAIAKVATKMVVPVALKQVGLAGYAGEGEADEVDKLSESGGTWHRRRGLPPVSTTSDLCWRLSLSLDAVQCDCPPLERLARPNGPLSSGFTLQKLSMPLSGHQDDQRERRVPHEEGSQSGDSASLTASSSHSRYTMGLDSGSETVPGSTRSSMQSRGDLLEELLDDEDVTLRREAGAGEEEQTAGGESHAQETQDALLSLFMDERPSQLCGQMPSRHPHSLSRLSQSQKETQRRISTLLVSGSDTIAMAIAPGARESMVSVARIMDASISSLDEVGEDAGMSEISSAGAPFRRRLGSSASAVAPPATTTACVRGVMDARSAVVSCSNTSASSASSATLYDELATHPCRTASSASWTSSITEAPYTLAMGILSLATWAATRPLAMTAASTLIEDGAVEGDVPVGSPMKSKPTISALSLTRQAYMQRHQIRRKATDRPKSHYRVDDTKLHPFPHFSNEDLPPVGIAKGGPVKYMDCAPAKQALHEPQQQRQSGWLGGYW